MKMDCRSAISRRALMLGLGASAALIATTAPVPLAKAMGSSTVTGASTVYTNAQDGTLVSRSNANAVMVDTLPGTSPGVLNAGTVITVHNDGTTLMSVGVGSGAQLDGIASGFVMLGPNQTASFHSDGSNYRSLIKPTYAKLGYGQPIILYIDQNGSDNNCGLTPALAFKTQQAAWNFAAFNIHINSGSIFFQLADSATEYEGLVCNGFHIGYGFGQVLFRGNPANWGAVKVKNTIAGLACFLASNGASIYVESLSLESVGNNLEANWYALIFFKNVIFGPSGNVHCQSITNGYIEGNGDYRIEAGAAVHWSTGNGGMIHVGGITITLANTPAFPSGFANASLDSRIFSLASFAGTGATGPKRVAQMNSIIYNAGPAALPGNSTQSPQTGSQFAGA